MRVVHYLNQFFGGLGGEDQAGVGVSVREGAVGPGQVLARMDGVQVLATVICGDNYLAENLDRAGQEVLAAIREYQPDVVLAGPAFNAGRYGVACGQVCQLVQEQLGIPAVTGMFEENAGVELFRRQVYIVRTAERATTMEAALRHMVALAGKLVRKEPIGPASEEGYLPRGVRRNGYADEPAGERAVAMLVKRLTGQPWETELALPPFDRITPAPALPARSAYLALVTTGGVVPTGNPDRMPVGRNSTYFRYSIAALDNLTPDSFEIHHAGYENKYANADPDRVVPLDVVRMMEREGRFEGLYPEYLVTSGQGAMVQAAVGIGRGMAEELRAKGVTGVVLTAT
ncbi:MAG: glycine/betaine/sarcosine/D-proline family reductase selenoprotein B [Chloroflexi bacterium]|nr:glycine/betaine/sarcosine/D-proline family reductase selenoprotein B [Chloroflexota bacterium]